jgi:hypothetical protein
MYPAGLLVSMTIVTRKRKKQERKRWIDRMASDSFDHHIMHDSSLQSLEAIQRTNWEYFIFQEQLSPSHRY